MEIPGWNPGPGTNFKQRIMSNQILYIVHHTFDCQDYNGHVLLKSEQEADNLFQDLVFEAKLVEIISEIYNETEDEFYFETSDSQQKIYITVHEL